MSQTPAIIAALGAVRIVAGVSIVYTRDGIDSDPITAIVGRTGYQQDEGSGVILRRQVRDYLVKVADLRVDEDLIEPKAGDRIVEGSTVYEVAPIDGGDTPWQFVDPGRTHFRIHTQQVGTV